MPYLKLRSNVEIVDSQAEGLLKQLSQIVAKQAGKPESYVMVELAGGRNMLFAGTNAPLAYLECKSIGLTTGQAKALSTALAESIAAALSIQANRVYIEFSNCPGEFWGWNGSTFG